MSGRPQQRRRPTQRDRWPSTFGVFFAVCCIALIVSFLAADRVVSGVQAVTGGARMGDIAVGIALVVLPPLAALVARSLFLRRRAIAWAYPLVLWAIPVGLSPYGKGVVILPALDSEEHRLVPDLLVGLDIGLICLVPLAAITLATHERHQRRVQRSRSTRWPPR